MQKEKLEMAGVREIVDPQKYRQDIASIIGHGINWRIFERNVTEEKIAPILYYNFKKQDMLDLLPKSTKEVLEKHFFACQRHTFAVENCFGPILKDITDKMQIIGLKGLVLSQTVYENFGIRAFTDIDLLVKEKDLGYLEKILVNKWGMHCNLHCPISRNYYAGSTSKVRFNPLTIDVAWEIIPVDRFLFAINWDTESVWANSTDIVIYQQPLKMLCYEDMTLHHIYHLAFHHKFSGLLWYVDLLKIIQRQERDLDWERILYCAGRYGISGVAYQILSFVKTQLHAPIKQVYLDKLKSQTSQFSLHQLSRFDNFDSKFSRFGFRNDLLPPLIFDRPYHAIKVFYRLLFPSWRWLRLNFEKNIPVNGYKRVEKINLWLYWWFLYLGWSIKRYFPHRKVISIIKKDKNVN